eukprot:1152598-Pelagomonas_calceolata.AAC.8
MHGSVSKVGIFAVNLYESGVSRAVEAPGNSPNDRVSNECLSNLQVLAAKGQRTLFDMGCTKRKREELVLASREGQGVERGFGTAREAFQDSTGLPVNPRVWRIEKSPAVGGSPGPGESVCGLFKTFLHFLATSSQQEPRQAGPLKLGLWESEIERGAAGRVWQRCGFWRGAAPASPIHAARSKAGLGAIHDYQRMSRDSDGWLGASRLGKGPLPLSPVVFIWSWLVLTAALCY